MKILSKVFMFLYFALLLFFGYLFSVLIMKLLGDDNNIFLQIVFGVLGVFLNFMFFQYVISKINEKIAKTSFMEDFFLFLFQLIITAAMFFLVWNTEWNFNSGSNSNDYNTNSSYGSDSDYSCYVCNKKGASYIFGSHHYCYDCYITAKAWHDTVN